MGGRGRRRNEYCVPRLLRLRCDLHPRWSRDSKKVSIDSAHEGSRQIYVLDVEKIVAG
jgi:Tol biopolymer transport system component